MGLSRTVSKINGDFSQKSQKNPTSRVFCAPAEGVPLGIGYRRWGSKNWNDGATGPTKTFDDIFSRLDRMHERDRQTDRWTDTWPQQRPRLRIASRSKNCSQNGCSSHVRMLMRVWMIVIWCTVNSSLEMFPLILQAVNTVHRPLLSSVRAESDCS